MSEVKLYHGDCLIEMNKIADKSIDALITDIPYFNVVDEKWDNQWKTEKEYLNWFENFIQIVNSKLKDNSSLIIFTSRQMNRKICYILDKYFEEKRIIIWVRKRGFNNTRGNSLASGYEPIAYYTKGKGTFNNLKIKVDSKRKEYTEGFLKDGICLSDVWSDISALPHNSKEKVNHPTQKPIKLMKRCIEMITNENDIVLDPFMGSGSCGVACSTTNRNFIGIEKDDKYFEIAENRIKEFEENIFNV